MSLEFRIRWTPDGVVVLRYDGSEVASEAKYAGINDALGGLRVALEAQEDEYHFPRDQYPTFIHVQTEKLARAIERRLP